MNAAWFVSKGFCPARYVLSDILGIMLMIADLVLKFQIRAANVKNYAHLTEFIGLLALFSISPVTCFGQAETVLKSNQTITAEQSGPVAKSGAMLPRPVVCLPLGQDEQGLLGASAISPANQTYLESIQKFIMGISGQELMIGEKAPMTYKLAEPFPMKEGTLVFWFRPLSWDDKIRMPLIGIGSYDKDMKWQGFAFSMEPYAGLHLHQVFRLPDSKLAHRYAPDFYTKQWKGSPKTWRCLVYTWRDEEVRVFINAIEIPWYPRPRPMDELTHTSLPPADLITIGGTSMINEQPAKAITVIDNVSLYKNMLTREQVLQEYKKTMGDLKDDF